MSRKGPPYGDSLNERLRKEADEAASAEASAKANTPESRAQHQAFIDKTMALREKGLAKNIHDLCISEGFSEVINTSLALSRSLKFDTSNEASITDPILAKKVSAFTESFNRAIGSTSQFKTSGAHYFERWFPSDTSHITKPSKATGKHNQLVARQEALTKYLRISAKAIDNASTHNANPVSFKGISTQKKATRWAAETGNRFYDFFASTAPFSRWGRIVSLTSSKHYRRSVAATVAAGAATHVLSYIPHLGVVISNMLNAALDNKIKQYTTSENNAVMKDLISLIEGVATGSKPSHTANDDAIGAIFFQLQRDDNSLKSMFENFTLLEKKIKHFIPFNNLMGGDTPQIDLTDCQDIEVTLEELYSMGYLNDLVLRQVELILSMCFAVLGSMAQGNFSRRIQDWIGNTLPPMIKRLEVTDPPKAACRTCPGKGAFSNWHRNKCPASSTTHAENITSYRSLLNVGGKTFGSNFGAYMSFLMHYTG